MYYKPQYVGSYEDCINRAVDMIEAAANKLEYINEARSLYHAKLDVDLKIGHLMGVNDLYDIKKVGA